MIAFGLSLPHRSPDPIDVTAVRQVAQRAEAVGFRDLWVTDNALDPAFSFDSLTILTYAAAVTTTIRLGVSVIVLPVQHPVHVAHRVATLDYVSNGRRSSASGWDGSITTPSSRCRWSIASADSARASSSSRRCGPSRR